jgi:hypothetical protein
MPAYLQITCLRSEYAGAWGAQNPFTDLFSIFNILVDKSKVGVIVIDCVKLFPVESGSHQISITTSRWNSSPPITVDVQDSQTIALICGIDKKAKLYIERDVPSSVAAQRLKEDSLQNNGNLYWASKRILIGIISLLLVVFFNLAIDASFPFGGGPWILANILFCSSYILIAIGISWAYGIITRRLKRDNE